MTVIVIIATLCLTNCRKDVILPNPEFKKLFGQWEWVMTSGGIGGSTTTPSTTGHNVQIEFKENGIYKSFEDGKRKDKMKFKFYEGSTLPNGSKEMRVKLEDIRFLNKDYAFMDKLIEFGSQDTLYLNDTFADGYCSVYIKK